MRTHTLIQHRKPVPNHWRIRDDSVVAASDADAPVAAYDIVSLASWRSLRERAAQPAGGHAVPLGILLSPDDDPRELQADLRRLALIAIRFPIFTDGRGYSSARLLRQQLRWTGPLMALGDVLRDQLLLLDRCGFDTLWLRDDQDLADALSAFGDFSDSYQATAVRIPLFARRRALAGART